MISPYNKVVDDIDYSSLTGETVSSDTVSALSMLSDSSEVVVYSAGSDTSTGLVSWVVSSTGTSVVVSDFSDTDSIGNSLVESAYSSTGAIVYDSLSYSTIAGRESVSS